MARRRNGEGSISKRPGGGYQVRRRYTDPITGEKRRVSLYGRTEAEVREKLKELNDRLDQGAPARDSRGTLGAWSQRWRSHTLPASGRSESSVRMYDSICRNHLERGQLAGIRLDRLRPSDVDAYMMSVKRQGYSAETARAVWKALRIVLDGAVRDSLIAQNPAAKVSAPRVEDRDIEALTSSQVSSIVAEARTAYDGRYYAITALIAHTGLRAGEACALRWRDVTEHAIHVRGTKTARSRRTVPIPPGVWSIIKAHKKNQLEERLRAGDQYSDSGEGLVFRTPLGDPIAPGSYSIALKRIAKRINLIATAHSLRHAFATHLIGSGMSPRTVADLLGHASSSITLAKYTHPTPEHHRAAIDRYAEGLNKGSAR